MSTFSERLVQQMLKLKQLEVDYETEQSSLSVKEKREVDLQKEVDEAEEQLKKVESLKAFFEKQNAEAEAQHREAKEKDQEERTAISQALTVKIEEVNRMSSELGKAEIAAEQEKQRYQRQLEIYNQHNSTEDKIKSIKESRDEEFKRLQDKQAKDMARVPEMEKLLAAETKALEELRKSHAEVKEKVDGYVSRFAGIQSLLDQSKKIHEEAKADNERMRRTIKKLEEDRTHAVARAQTSQKERVKEFDRMRKLEEKLALLQSQQAKLKSLLDFLDGKAPAPESDAQESCGDSEAADTTSETPAHVDPVVENDTADSDTDNDEHVAQTE